MERDFLPRAKTWKTVRRTRNQDAAHAHKRVTAPLSLPYGTNGGGGGGDSVDHSAKNCKTCVVDYSFESETLTLLWFLESKYNVY